MDVVRFTIEDGLFPVYRVLTLAEKKMLRSLFGQVFEATLAEGVPLDDLLLDVLVVSDAQPGFLFSPPDGARLVGTFQLRGNPSRHFNRQSNTASADLSEVTLIGTSRRGCRRMNDRISQTMMALDGTRMSLL